MRIMWTSCGGLGHPAVGATIDIGHCAYFAEVACLPDPAQRAAILNEVIGQLVRDLGGQVYHFHVHNVRPYQEVDFSRVPYPYWKPGSLVDHRALAEGLIDFPRLFGVLRAVGYPGLFELELEEPDREATAVESGKFLARLIEEFLLP
jgi:sugar phosphate isomerase/epimerase